MATQRKDPRRRSPDQNANKGPEVIYSPAKPFQRSRLTLQLLTVFALVLAVFLGLSVFFKVEAIEVVGANKHTAEAVAEASGIEKGDSLFFFGRAAAYSRIRSRLAYVKIVRFGIELPGTVKILIEEAAVVYAVQDSEDGWWLMDSDGRITEKSDSTALQTHTQILGVRLESPQVGQTAAAHEPQAPAQPEGEEKPVVIRESDKLTAALAIVRQLERNQILGTVTKIEVAELQNLQFHYGDRFRVELGDSSRLEYKMALVKAAITQMSAQSRGILDVSLKRVTDGVHYKPFDGV